MGIFTTVFVSEERDSALSGFASPLGSCAKQMLTRGSLGTLALYRTPPIRAIRWRKWLSPLANDSRFDVLEIEGFRPQSRASERPGRTYRQSETGRVVSFLVSGAVTGMTGDVIYVDGGLHLVA
jgi:hypothetical protein